MTDLRKFAWVGLLGLGLASIGCGSKTSTTGTGGSNGSGGSSATGGKGGSSSTGGSNGSGGSSAGGAGGAGPTSGCLASDLPTGPEIADFSGADGGIGIEIMHGDNDPFTYGDIPPPSYTPLPGSVEVTDNVGISPTKNHYQGFGIYFNGNSDGTDCINASSYTGVQFDISGTLVGDNCTMQFSINDSEHADSTVLKTKGDDASGPNDPKASGPMGAYAPQLQIGPMIMAGTTTIKVPFMGTGAPVGGLPADTAIDTMRIEGVQWQLTTPLMADGGATECDLDVKISNVKFY